MQPKETSVRIIQICACGEKNEHIKGLGEDGTIYLWRESHGWFFYPIKDDPKSMNGSAG